VKRTILAILIATIVSMSISAVDASVTLGTQQKMTLGRMHDPLYVTIDVWQNFNKLQVYGEYTNEMAKSNTTWMFQPSQDYFTVGIQYDFTIFSVRLEHMCTHPVSTQGKPLTNNYGLHTKFEVIIGGSR